jgi:hypothetical protein
MEYVGEVRCTEYPEFYLVPGLRHTYIHVRGKVYDAKRKLCPLPFISSVEYPAVNVEGETRHIHRLLALTFLPVPDISVEELDVNHIDGVKTNYALDNLEWTTRSENCLHAYQTGLRDDNTPVLVKDLRDGSIVRYYSLHQCARAFEVLPETVFHHLKDFNYGKVSWSYYVLIREGQEWPDIDETMIGAHRNGCPKFIGAVNQEQRKIMLFESIGVAAEHFGLKANTLGMHMRRHGSKPRGGWTFWFIDGDKWYNKQGEVFTGIPEA